jgi:hypothetical protein
LVEASSEADATTVVNSCERSAVDVSVLAEASSSVEADDTVSTISPTARSKRRRAEACRAALRGGAGFRLLLLTLHADPRKAISP